jgi:hypothetical protein
MSYIIHFLLLQLDPKEKVKFSNTLLNRAHKNPAFMVFEHFTQYIPLSNFVNGHDRVFLNFSLEIRIFSNTVLVWNNILAYPELHVRFQ